MYKDKHRKTRIQFKYIRINNLQFYNIYIYSVKSSLNRSFGIYYTNQSISAVVNCSITVCNSKNQYITFNKCSNDCRYKEIQKEEQLFLRLMIAKNLELIFHTVYMKCILNTSDNAHVINSESY